MRSLAVGIHGSEYVREPSAAHMKEAGLEPAILSCSESVLMFLLELLGEVTCPVNSRQQGPFNGTILILVLFNCGH